MAEEKKPLTQMLEMWEGIATLHFNTLCESEDLAEKRYNGMLHTKAQAIIAALRHYEIVLENYGP